MLIKGALKRAAIEQFPKLQTLIDVYSYRNHQPYYWEFAIDTHNPLPYIVQAAPIEQKAEDINVHEGVIVFQGKDTVNTGTRTGKGIIVIEGETTLSEKLLKELQEINKTCRNFLLVGPDVMLSSIFLDKHQINLSHFGNAAGIVEIRYNTGAVQHSNNMGGSHFAELCQRKDILYLGVETPESTTLIGEKTEEIDLRTYFYDAEYKITNTSNGGQVEIMKPSCSREFQRNEMYDWACELSSRSHELFNEFFANFDNPIYLKKHSIQNIFIEILTQMMKKSKNYSMAEFDPFGIVKQTPLEMIPTLLGNILILQNNLELLPSYRTHLQEKDELKEYGIEEKYPFADYLNRVKELLLEQYQ